MKRALLLVALAACEKDSGTHVHAPPAKVGDRIDYHFRHDGQLTSSDGQEHGSHGETSLILEVLAVTNGHPDRMRITVDRDDQVFDGAAKPSLSGTYEVNAAGELSRGSGKPLTDYDRQYFRDWHIATDVSTIANHEFHTGDTWHPTGDEAVALGMPAAQGPWVLHCTRADDEAIVLTAEYDYAGAHATTTITLTAVSRTHVTDLTVRDNGKDIGAAHSTYVLRPQR